MWIGRLAETDEICAIVRTVGCADAVAVALLPVRKRQAEVPDEVLKLRWDVADVLVVRGDHWWSLSCDDRRCCPPEGRPIRGSGLSLARINP